MYALLKRLLEIPSGTKQIDGVNKVCELLLEQIAGLPCNIEEFTHNDFGNMIHIQSLRWNNEMPRLLLVGHMDTVYNNIIEPLIEENGNKLYGPGTHDMKAGLVILIETFKKLFDINLFQNIGILLVPEEEQINQDHFPEMEDIANQYTHALVFEGDDRGVLNPKTKSLVVQRRGFHGGKVTLSAAGGHSGLITNKKDIHSAIHSAIELTSRILKESKFQKGTNINIGKINGGNAVNSFAENCEVDILARVNTIEEFRRIKKVFRNPLLLISDKKVKATFEVNHSLPPMSYSASNKKFYKLAEEALKDIIPTEIEMRGGGSDANRLIYFNPKLAILDSLGPIGGKAHSKEEYIYPESMYSAIRIAVAISTAVLK